MVKKWSKTVLEIKIFAPLKLSYMKHEMQFYLLTDCVLVGVYYGKIIMDFCGLVNEPRRLSVN